jgi:hypothetical protein
VFFNVLSKGWPSGFAASRKPVEDRPALEGLIELLRSAGLEPDGEDNKLFMESYDDDLTTLDLQSAIQYLQSNDSDDLHDSTEAVKSGTAWLDDRTFDHPGPQELSNSTSLVATEHLSMHARHVSHCVDNSEVAGTHPPWTIPLETNGNECDIADVALDTLQGLSYTGYNISDSFLTPCGARSARHYPAPLTADDLHSYLREKQFDHTRYLDADRRLIYIADPDSSYLSALIKTARPYQKRSLQDTICKYIAQDTSIKVSISEGCTEYQLEFHIPYLAMRYRHFRSSTERRRRAHRGWMNIDFLDTKRADAGARGICGVHQAQISVTICGTDNSRWTAYCLEDRYFDEDGEMGGDEQTENHQSDQIARGVFGAEDIIRDPREYFLRVFLIRMRQVHTERINLVRRIELGIKDHSWGRFFYSNTRDGIPSAVHDATASSWIDPTVQLLAILLDDIANTNDAWSRFTSDTGDVAYFYDTRSNPRMVTTFNQLNDVFDQMLDLEKKLRRIAEQCEQRAQTLSLRLVSESKRSAELTIYFISPFAIVSTFFAIPVPFIAFPRNIFSFFFAIVLYTVGLQAVLFFWGGGLLQQPWWNKISRRAKALRDGDPGFTKKTEDGSTVLQRKSTAGCVV